MKSIAKFFLKYYLKYLTKLALLVHRPVIIAVAGSTNKTFVRDEIVKNLKETGKTVRANPRNFNTEIGLPLAILDLPSGYNSWRHWLPVLHQAPLAVFRKDFPEYLVVELGASRPADMKYLLTIVKPHVSVITDINQRYIEAFSDMEDLVSEYRRLVAKTEKNGTVILNYDNIRVRGLARKAKAKVVYFGFGESSDWKIEKVEKAASGQKIRILHKETEQEYMTNRFGLHNALALAAGQAAREAVK